VTRNAEVLSNLSCLANCIFQLVQFHAQQLAGIVYFSTQCEHWCQRSTIWQLCVNDHTQFDVFFHRLRRLRLQYMFLILLQVIKHFIHTGWPKKSKPLSRIIIKSN